MPSIRDIYKVRIYYNGQSGRYKSRPALILNDLANGWCTIAEITGTGPKDQPTYFDKFKEPIKKWQESGLDKESWVKCYKENIHNIENSRLFEHIGKMDLEDFQNAVMNIHTNND